MCIQWLEEETLFESEGGKEEELEGGFAVAMRAYERALDWVLKVRGYGHVCALILTKEDISSSALIGQYVST